MPLLLVLVLVLLAITLWLTAKLIIAAHRRAAVRAGREAALAAFEEDQDEATSFDSFRLPQVSREVAFEEGLQAPNQTPSPSANRDVYADPIDGVPFLRGEHAIPCPCGVAYRVESLDWLATHCSGRCVQCGSPIESGAAKPGLACVNH